MQVLARPHPKPAASEAQGWATICTFKVPGDPVALASLRSPAWKTPTHPHTRTQTGARVGIYTQIFILAERCEKEVYGLR